MISRRIRDTAIQLLQDFRDGKITNDEFDNSWPDSPESADDAALRAIGDMMWNVYDDGATHTLEGKHALSHEARALLDRCIRFLQSDLEYTWPSVPLKQISGLGWQFRVLTLGLAALADRYIERRNQRIEGVLREHGDLDVWPFTSRALLERHLATWLTPPNGG